MFSCSCKPARIRKSGSLPFAKSLFEPIRQNALYPPACKSRQLPIHTLIIQRATSQKASNRVEVTFLPGGQMQKMRRIPPLLDLFYATSGYYSIKTLITEIPRPMTEYPGSHPEPRPHKGHFPSDEPSPRSSGMSVSCPYQPM